MRTLAYVLLILGSLTLNLISDLFLSGPVTTDWDGVGTVMTGVGCVLLGVEAVVFIVRHLVRGRDRSAPPDGR